MLGYEAYNLKGSVGIGRNVPNQDSSNGYTVRVRFMSVISSYK